MCYIVHHVHTQCQHNRKSEILEHCPEYESGNCIPIPNRFVQITAPSLCTTCFRKEEARIDGLYESQADEIRKKIAEYKASDQEDVRALHASGKPDWNIVWWEIDLKHKKSKRDRLIKAFRLDQGVWGDG